MVALVGLVTLVACAPPNGVSRGGSTALDDAATEPGSKPLPPDDRVTIDTLDNGLTYLVRANPRPERRAELWLVVNAGSILEDEDQRGLAHFVEHMCFNGTERFPRQKMVEYLESAGMRYGADLNAYTSYDETVYTLRVPTDNPAVFDTSLAILADWIGGGVQFEPQEVDKERGVVVEEWRLGRGANGRLADQHNPVLLAGSRYADREPIGKKEVLETAPRDAIARFYHDWYRPDLAAVIAVGDFDAAAIAEQIRQHFGALPRREGGRPRTFYKLPEHADTKFSIVADPELTETQVAVYYKHPRRSEATTGDYRRFLLENLYDFMVNARLSELTQGTDPPFLAAQASSEDLVRTASTYVQAAIPPEGETERSLAALLTEAERIDRFGFSQSELDRAKALMRRTYQQATAENGKTDANTLAAEYTRHFLEGEPVPGIALELALVERFLPTITLEEANQLGREWISENNRVVLVGGPATPDHPLPTEEALSHTFEEARKAEVTAYVDRVIDEPLLATLPEPGKVVAESSIDDLGVTEWKLSNGVRVIAKPTDFQNDQILLTAFSPGGTSIVDDADYNSAIFAATLLSEGGLGRFPKVELEKALAGKLASVNMDLDELEEGLTASSSKVDLETMFQLIYLGFTAPRADAAAADAFLAKLGNLIQDRLASPENVFQDRLSEALYQDHPRRQPLTKETLKTIDVQRALAVYRERFADASGFTFVLVGSFDLPTLRPLVERYLGGLPALNRNENYRDIGVRPPARKVDVRVAKGSEPKAAVSLVFSGETTFSLLESHQINTLAEILSLKLRDLLREDRGQTYDVSADASISPRPVPTYSFSVSFGCAPENVDSLLATVFAEIRKLRQKGPEPEALAKVAETQLRERQSAMRENGFWLRTLANSVRLGLDPHRYLAISERVRATTPRALRDAARRYLTMDRYILGVLGPETASASVSP